jgi:hypothetical protein
MGGAGFADLLLCRRSTSCQRRSGHCPAVSRASCAAIAWLMESGAAEETLLRAAREGHGDDEVVESLHALRRELTASAPAHARRRHVDAMRRAAESTHELSDATLAAGSTRRRSHRNAARPSRIRTGASVNHAGQLGERARPNRRTARALRDSTWPNQCAAWKLRERTSSHGSVDGQPSPRVGSEQPPER